MTIGERISKRRAALGLTQDELARKLKVDKSAIAHWEAGDWKPRNLERVVVRGLGMTMSEFWVDAKKVA